MQKENQNIILFDGVCNLCEASVQFIIKHDEKNYFHFASQSSDIGKKLWEEHKLQEIDSIVLVSNGLAHTHSDAVLEIAKNLDAWYGYLYIFHFVPTVLRDFIYKLVAKHRYKVFGKKDSCMMPSSEIEDRFLDTNKRNMYVQCD